MGASASLCIAHGGNLFGDVFSTKSFAAGRDAVVLQGGDVGLVVALVSEVLFSRLVFSWPNRVLLCTSGLTSFRAVLPHGNSAGGVRKEESRCRIVIQYDI